MTAAARATSKPAVRGRWAPVALITALTAALALPASRPSVTTGASRPVATAPVAAVDDALVHLRDSTVHVVVQTWPGARSFAERAVHRAHGTVTRDLPIVNGAAATIPTSAIPALARTPGVRALSLDRRVAPQGSPSSSDVRSVYRKVVRTDQLNQHGLDGRGVTVALVDTGIADVPDLSGRVLPVTDDLTGRVTACENLSGEASCDDSYGHGTFVAGLIAGNGAASSGKWTGAASGADLVSVKIAGRDGSADVSGVIAAIQWVVSFKDRYGIRVLNLSLGTDSTQSYRVDPLNYAVEKAWAAGVVVVVSASNRGPAPGTISKPGDDPWVVTVGATDDRGTVPIGDDQLPDFSSRGPTAADGLAKPDVVAPGAHVVSLRAPGSVIDTQFPTYIDGSYRRGSGTSMATGIVSGSVADMLSATPTLTPDQVKHALAATARPVASDDPMAVGAGVVDAFNATFNAPAGLANQGLDRSSGLGSLDLSRGSVRVQADDPARTVVGGLLTAQLLLWDPLGLVGVDWVGSNWYGSNWYGSNWYGSNWYGSNWYGSNWYGSNWYGQFDGSNWYGSNWYGSNWYGVWQ